MYKIKLFHNMSGLVAGQSIKQIVTSKDWWKGMFSNMVSTMIGICLTIGVAALVEHHNDKKLSREMMFNIVKVCEDDAKEVVKYDSTFQSQEKAIVTMHKLYKDTKFQNMTKEQKDSFNICMGNIMNIDGLYTFHNQVGKYFYSAQMLHQFGNAKVYDTFAEFIQLDQTVYENIDQLLVQYKAIVTNLEHKTIDDDKKLGVAITELIKEHKFTDYVFAIRLASLNIFGKAYKDSFNDMLKEMGATKEEYEEYKKSIDTGINTDHSYSSKF